MRAVIQQHERHADHGTSTIPGCHVMKLNWFLPALEQSCDQRKLKNNRDRWSTAGVSFAHGELCKHGREFLYSNFISKYKLYIHGLSNILCKQRLYKYRGKCLN